MIRVGKGVYRETVTIDKAVALVGEDGAVINPSQSVSAHLGAGGSAGQGRLPRLGRPAAARPLPWGKGCGRARRPPAGDESGRRSLFWWTLLSHGPRRSGFQHIRVLWIYRRDERAIFGHLAEDADPGRGEWSCVWSTDALITFRGATDASVSRLSLAYGQDGVVLRHGSKTMHRHSLRYRPLEQEWYLFDLGGDGMRGREQRDLPGGLRKLGPEGHVAGAYEIWQIHKEAGFYDRVGIDLVRAGRATGCRNRLPRRLTVSTWAIRVWSG